MEVCKALGYGQATKTADIVNQFCRQKNYAQKYQISCVNIAGTRVDWPID